VLAPGSNPVIGWWIVVDWADRQRRLTWAVGEINRILPKDQQIRVSQIGGWKLPVLTLIQLEYIASQLQGDEEG
jgi:hypothetical protein